MIISKNYIKKETEKAFLISKKRGPFHEVRNQNNRQLVCKIFYVQEGWVAKSLCKDLGKSIEFADSLVPEIEQIRS